MLSLVAGYLWERRLTTALNVLLVAIAVALLTVLLVFASQANTRFTKDAEGIDLVVGAKGSPLQLSDRGVWRLPDGEAFYALALRSQTTAALGAEEIHRMGLAQVADLQGQLEPLLRAQGFTRGTVGQRLNALARDPRFLYPNADAGRAEILASLERQMADLAPLLSRMFNTLPRANVVIRRVPPAIEAGAPFGYYSPPSLDGLRPGAFYINLRDTSEWPRHSLPSFTYHEAMPGHHLQIALVRETLSLPLYRRTLSFPGYGEGWGRLCRASGRRTRRPCRRSAGAHRISLLLSLPGRSALGVAVLADEEDNGRLYAVRLAPRELRHRGAGNNEQSSSVDVFRFRHARSFPRGIGAGLGRKLSDRAPALGPMGGS